MRNVTFRIAVIAALLFAFLTGCDGVNTQGATQEPKTDTVAVVETLPVEKEVVKLVGDPLLNSLARILAGIPLQEGDTLYRISTRFYGSSAKWRAIRELNKTTISTDGRLRAGQVIRLP